MGQPRADVPVLPAAAQPLRHDVINLLINVIPLRTDARPHSTDKRPPLYRSETPHRCATTPYRCATTPYRRNPPPYRCENPPYRCCSPPYRLCPAATPPYSCHTPPPRHDSPPHRHVTPRLCLPRLLPARGQRGSATPASPGATPTARGPPRPSGLVLPLLCTSGGWRHESVPGTTRAPAGMGLGNGRSPSPSPSGLQTPSLVRWGGRDQPDPRAQLPGHWC